MMDTVMATEIQDMALATATLATMTMATMTITTMARGPRVTMMMTTMVASQARVPRVDINTTTDMMMDTVDTTPRMGTYEGERNKKLLFREEEYV